MLNLVDYPNGNKEHGDPHEHQECNWKNERVKNNVFIQCVAEYWRKLCQSKTQPLWEVIPCVETRCLTVGYCRNDRQQWDYDSKHHQCQVNLEHAVSIFKRVEWEPDFPEQNTDVEDPPDIELQHAVVENYTCISMAMNFIPHSMTATKCLV